MMREPPHPVSSLAALSVQGLTKTFASSPGWRQRLFANKGLPLATPPTRALAGVDLEVRRGEVVAVMGTNGAGKSTLLRCVATAVIPDGGQMRVYGEDPVTAPHEVRRLVGYLRGDERSFHFRLTIRQNLEFFAALEHLAPSVAAARVQDLLAEFQLTPWADLPYHAASSGIRQRALLVRGLLGAPSLILADEPTRSLDPQTAQWVLRVLIERYVLAHGGAMLLVSHDSREVRAVAGRVVVLEHGVVVAQGTPNQVLGEDDPEAGHEERREE